MAAPLRVRIEPRSISVTPGEPFSLTVAIFNASQVIEEYSVTLLGLDASWVVSDPASVSLFPETEEAATLTVTLPDGFLAGRHQIGVKVERTTTPGEPWVGDLELIVGPVSDVALVVEPASVTAGRQAKFTVRVANRGNNPLPVELSAVDAEQVVEITFSENPVEVAPGRETLVIMTASPSRSQW